MPDVPAVVSALQACSHFDASVRKPAETALKQWESSFPGLYLSNLLAACADTANVSLELRLLAAIMIKNAIPVVWALSNHRASPSRPLSTEEKLKIRTQVASLLFTEPKEQIALQFRLALAGISCFDYPTNWPSLLQDLIQIALLADVPEAQQQYAPWQRLRAIKAIQYVLQAAKMRRITIHKPSEGGNGATEEHVFSVKSIRQAMQEAATLQRQVQQGVSLIFGNLTSGALQHAALFIESSQKGELSLFDGAMCVGYLKSLTELLSLVSRSKTSDSFQSDFSPFLTQVTMLLEKVKLYGGDCNDDARSIMADEFTQKKEQQTAWADKIYRHALHCCIAAMGCAPLLFAPHVPRILEIVLQDGIVGMDEATLQRLPMKRLVIQTRFVIAAIMCPDYIHNRHHGDVATPGQQQNPRKSSLNSNPTTKVDIGLYRAREAVVAITKSIKDGGLCETLVHALVTKFLCLSRAEMKEWEDDPEGHFQIDEAERAPGTDPDKPRHCGGILLALMMDRAPLQVGQAILVLAQQCQQMPPNDLTGLIQREASYRALELCRGSVMKNRNELDFSFQSWWTGELRALLQTNLAHEQPVPMRMLQARAIQVLHAYSIALSNEQEYTAAFVAVSQLLAAPDLVTALCAARCANHLALLHFKEKEITPQLAAVQENSMMALGNAFALANRVNTEESLRTVLMLVSGLVEVNGTSLQSCLHAIAEQLPPLWERAGDSVPVHSCLLSVLNHLIAKLGYIAVENTHVQTVLFPLLDYCTDVSVTHRADTLLEDGLRLWLVVLVTSRVASLGSSLSVMLPRLEAILRSRCEVHLSLKVLQYYVTLMGPNVLHPLANVTTSLLVNCMSCITTKTVANAVDEEEMKDSSDASDGNTSGTIKDGIAALKFCDDILQLVPDLGYEICQPALSAAFKSLPESAFPYPLVEAAFGALGRLVWHRPTFLEDLFLGDANEPKLISSLVNSWLDLASHPPIMRVITSPTLLLMDQRRAASSLCAAVCHGPKVRSLAGKAVLEFASSLVEVERKSKTSMNDLVEAACGSTRQVIGDGPWGDADARIRDIVKSDPLLANDLKEAVECVRVGLSSN